MVRAGGLGSWRRRGEDVKGREIKCGLDSGLRKRVAVKRCWSGGANMVDGEQLAERCNDPEKLPADAPDRARSSTRHWSTS